MDDRPSTLHGYAGAVTPLDTERITFKAVKIMAALIYDCLVGIETLTNEEKRPLLFLNRGVLVSLAIQKLDLDDHVAEQGFSYIPRLTEIRDHNAGFHLRVYDLPVTDIRSSPHNFPMDKHALRDHQDKIRDFFCDSRTDSFLKDLQTICEAMASEEQNILEELGAARRALRTILADLNDLTRTPTTRDVHYAKFQSVVEFVPGLVFDTEPSENRAMLIGVIVQPVPYVAGEVAKNTSRMVFNGQTYIPDLNQSAFYPETIRTANFTTSHPLLNWWINSGRWGPLKVELHVSITVRLVLKKIHEYLRTPVTVEEA
ncbi:hypothetical protein F5146DRAFT_1182114 [Armillaria mellea]|nr:hypothetical protein F5146DRAFT_1182114 [Armillaria mellea]